MVKGKVLVEFANGEIEGLANVAVSNGEQVVVTDSDGCYELPDTGDAVIFISKPSDYELLVDEYMQPQYYYIHSPKGSPRDIGLKYAGIQPTGPLPAEVNFRVKPGRKAEAVFSAVIMGDIQPKEEEHIAFFRDMVARDLAHQEVDFMLLLGDLTWDDLALYPLLKDTLKAIDLPYFPVFGNHDMNLKAPEKKYTTETFKRYFGPPYYSFNYGKNHFVVLDDVGYTGWNDELDKKGETLGWIDDKQLKWLEQDLALVPDEYQVIIASHIPIFTAASPDNPYRNVQNREALFNILKDRKKLFAVSAHTHCIEHVDLRDVGWQEEQEFHQLIAGAACGAWWKGPLELDGLPARLAMDGAPNGFFKFDFRQTDFDYHFIPASDSIHNQVGIRLVSRDIAQDEIPEEIIVNIYAASPKAAVTYTINDGEPILMERFTGQDPYVIAFVDNHRASYTEWMQARVTTHLWKAPWPKLIDPGVYKLMIKAVEPNGRAIVNKQAFRILPDISGAAPDKLQALKKMIRALED